MCRMKEPDFSVYSRESACKVKSNIQLTFSIRNFIKEMSLEEYEKKIVNDNDSFILSAVGSVEDYRLLPSRKHVHRLGVSKTLFFFYEITLSSKIWKRNVSNFVKL